MKRWLTTLIRLIALTAINSLTAWADDPYKDLIKSREYVELSHHSRREETASGFRDGPWFRKGSAYSSIFLEAKGQFQLITWSAPLSSRYVQANPPRVGNSKIFAMATVTYREKLSKRLVDVGIFVLHPAYVEMADVKVIPEIAALEPPTLKIEESKEMAIGKQKAMAYWHTDDKCSLLFSLPRRSYLRIQSHEKCFKFDDLQQLAESMNIQKLTHKLED